MLDYQSVSTFRKPADRRSYTLRDTSLYALSVSPDVDPLDHAALALLLETRGPRVLPTMASVLAQTLSPYLGLDMPRVVHAEQRLACHRPIPPAGDLVIDGRVTSVIDKGPGKGALVTFENVARLVGEDAPLFTLANTLFARGDGGCGGPAGDPPARHALPDRAPDVLHRTQGRRDQALFYRLNGDLNPLHADPAFAGNAGFPRPILHGLCTYGMACRAIVMAMLDGNPDLIASFDVRFTAPVYPGELLVTEMWDDGDVISFRCRALERDVIVLDNGRCGLRLVS